MNITTLCIEHIELKLCNLLDLEKHCLAKDNESSKSPMRLYYKGRVEILQEVIDFIARDLNDMAIEKLLNGGAK